MAPENDKPTDATTTTAPSDDAPATPRRPLEILAFAQALARTYARRRRSPRRGAVHPV